MNQEIKERWVKALRSGKYKQGKGSLRRIDSSTKEVTYCCLGVLSCLYLDEHPERNNNLILKGEYLSFEVIKWAGLENKNKNPVYLPTDEDVFCLMSLSALNDSGDYSFSDIADVIEKNL